MVCDVPLPGFSLVWQQSPAFERASACVGVISSIGVCQFYGPEDKGSSWQCYSVLTALLLEAIVS